MSFSEGFDIGYLKIYANKNEEVFLTITPNLRYGPGISVTAFRMRFVSFARTHPFMSVCLY